MTFNQSFVVEKLTNLKEYLLQIKSLFTAEDKDILSDSVKMHAVERLLQLVVDAMLDINQHIIREKNLEISEDFQGTFYVLGENMILPEEFANKIAPVVGMRNRIVHGYETLNKNLLITNLRNNYSDFEKYIALIQKYISELK